jgi:periplasmic nitrate reductase NapD
MSPVMDRHTSPQSLSGDDTGQSHVASLIVHVKPQALDALLEWLGGLDGVEVPVSSPEGKLVVVSESHSERAIADLMQAVGDREGVLNTAMVYHEIIENEDVSP